METCRKHQRDIKHFPWYLIMWFLLMIGISFLQSKASNQLAWIIWELVMWMKSILLDILDPFPSAMLCIITAYKSAQKLAPWPHNQYILSTKILSNPAKYCAINAIKVAVFAKWTPIKVIYIFLDIQSRLWFPKKYCIVFSFHYNVTSKNPSIHWIKIDSIEPIHSHHLVSFVTFIQLRI